MIASSSRAFSRVLNKRTLSSHCRGLATEPLAMSSRTGKKTFCFLISGAVGVTFLAHEETKRTSMAARLPSSGDVLSVGTPVIEAATGIAFPQLCNGFRLVGQGVRIKYVFVKVYAVGTYMDPVAMMAVKKGSAADIERALLDPTYPRTIRIVMNRNLSIEKYTAAIIEALEPRMNGQELEKLEEFKKLNPPVDLVQGAEIELTIRGDTLLYKNAVGGVGSLQSQKFMEAMCDVFYGDDPVSPPHKESVLEGVRKL